MLKISPGNAARQTANDLRRTHFTLGKSNPNGGTSEYLSKFRATSAALESSQRDKLNLRESHFQMGSKQASDMYVTVKQKDFRHHVDVQIARLNDEKKADLRSHHFSLGNHQPNFQTMTNYQYGEKHIEIDKQKQEQEDQKTKMRKHNFNFGNSNQAMYSSVYNKAYNKEFNPDDLKQALTAEALKQKVLDLRQSSVVFGADHHPMTTIHQKDYQPKNNSSSLAGPSNDNVAIRRTNLVLGDAQPDYQSVNQAYYVDHTGTEKPQQNTELCREIKATHFSLGNDFGTKNSLMQASYAKPPNSAKPAQILHPNLQSNHFSLNYQGDKLANKTTYSSTIINHGAPELVPRQEKGKDALSNFVIGNQQGSLVSEAQAHYVQHNVHPDSLNEALKADLRRSHFHFNDVKPQFKTLVQASYTKKDLPNHDNITAKLAEQLRSTNFQLGQQNTALQSSSQAAYSNNNGKPTELNTALGKELKRHHFAHGDGKWHAESVTEYRENFAEPPEY